MSSKTDNSHNFFRVNEQKRPASKERRIQPDYVVVNDWSEIFCHYFNKSSQIDTRVDRWYVTVFRWKLNGT